MPSEEILAGGHASGDAVVRVGRTVRKPWTSSTTAVLSFVEWVRQAGVDAPEPLGRDEQGRQVQELVPGVLAMDGPPLSRADLRRVGGMVRAIHDASASYFPPGDAVWSSAIAAPGQDLVCHNDLAPWNLIIGERWVFIDWDASAPSTRLWDLAYAAQAFTLNDAGRAPSAAAEDLRAFVDGYDAEVELRRMLPAAMGRRTAAMHDLLRSSHEAGREPWGSMFLQGHGRHWEAAHEYVVAHQDVWARAIDTSPR